MNKLISALRSSLIEIVKRMDNEDCYLSDDEAEEIIAALKRINSKDIRLSKYQACKYLNVSRATFDNYVRNGWIPKGTHQQGFKELSWLQKDLDKFKNTFKKNAE